MSEYYCYNCNENYLYLTDKNECPKCKDGSDIVEISECCGEEIGDERICPDCKEHC